MEDSIQASANEPMHASSNLMRVWTKLLPAFLVGAIVGGAAIHIASQPQLAADPVMDTIDTGGTKVYYSPQTKTVFSYTKDNATTEKIYLDHHGSEIDIQTPSDSDVVLLEIPNESTSIFHASTTVSGKIIFTLLTKAYTLLPVNASSGYPYHEKWSDDNTQVFVYDPGANRVQVVSMPSEMEYPRLATVSSNETKLTFHSQGCYRCGAGHPRTEVVDLTSHKRAYIGHVSAFEWLEDNKFRYKELVADPARVSNCDEYGGCFLPPESLDWINGAL